MRSTQLSEVSAIPRSRAGGGGVSPLPQPENKLYYPALDGLRAIAVFLVFSAHYFSLPPSLYWGRVGVDMFFVLSGFLITGILYDSMNRRDRYSVFYKRRVLRIFPLYYFVLLLPVLGEPIFHWVLHPALWLWPLYAGNYAPFLWPADLHSAAYEVLRATRGLHFLTWHLDHLWSLCVEEQFYLVWPLVVYALRDRVTLRNLCLVAVVVVPLLRWLCVASLSPRWIDSGLLYVTTPLRADSLLLGGALALALRGPDARYVRAFPRPLAVFLGATFVVWQFVSYRFSGHLIDPVWSSLHNPLFATFTALSAAVLIVPTIDPATSVYHFLNNKVLRAIGQRSYGFYVYHLMLYSVYATIARSLSHGHRGVAGAALAPVAFIGTLLVSWASFRYFEAPILRLKDRIAR